MKLLRLIFTDDSDKAEEVFEVYRKAEADAEIARIETENTHLHEQTDKLMKRVAELEKVIDNCASMILDSVTQEGDLLKNVNKVLAILIESQPPEDA